MAGLFSPLNKDKQLKLAFWKIKEELNGHLDTINQNTDEISEAFEAIVRIEEKLDRMEAKLEMLELERSTRQGIIHLSLREQEVFIALYHAGSKMTLRDIADMLSLDQDVVNTLLSNLVAKGIPVLKQATNEHVFLYLDKDFREQHSRKPLVYISEQVMASVSEEK